ncbi:hypothetical protein [Ahrensia sp. 13_GOM-1096m]|uniref:hypothetical protein n=1 Tax=Ahrensia sp. 13_GOM-1096m TaxID=1380380 RepID=UPI000478D6CE|nr:hypothetical protein [Ahrensia sp. 13_GOM-1096m]
MILNECILTQSNAALLQRLFDAQHAKNTPFSMLLKAKLENAQICSESDLPANIVTLDSRVTYSVNDVFTDTRILSAHRSNDIVGLSLSITNLRGLALIGLKEGDYYHLTEAGQETDLLHVKKVRFQPEAHRQFLKDSVAENSPSKRRASMKLVHSANSQHDFMTRAVRPIVETPGYT